MNRLILIPWHIGDRRDVTINALGHARRLSLFVVEDPDDARRAFAELVPGGLEGKTFLPLPVGESPELLARVLAALEREDVGLLASGGAPCFLDPGAWLVRAARERGAAVTALAGASCLSTLLSLSGVEFLGKPDVAGVLFYARQYSRPGPGFAEALRAHGEAQASVVLLRACDLRACLSELAALVGDRRVSVFTDLTKDKAKYPYGGEVRTRTCGEWLSGWGELDWARVGEASLLVHPREAA